MGHDLRFTVLGSVGARHDDVEVETGPPQQRAVLAALLLGDGKRASVDALVGALWGAHAPRSAPSVVRTYVSRLRGALAKAGEAGGPVIETTPNGYALSAVHVDLDDFRDCFARARAVRDTGDLARAAVLLRSGLALWSGRPLDGITAPFAAQHRAMLEELRLVAVEDCLALEVSSGAHSRACVELAVLVDRHPLRERLRELLMLALYRSGRRTDALDAYGVGRRLLSQELGVDPGPGLRRLHQGVLADDHRLLDPGADVTAAAPPASRDERRTALAAFPGSARAGTADAAVQTPAGESWAQAENRWLRPCQLPPSLPVFTGREAELEQLDALLESREAGRRSATVVAIDGMSGVGKTTLAVQWGHRVAARFPDGQVYLDLRGFGGGGPAMTNGEALGTLLSALGVAEDDVPRETAARTGLYRSRLAGRRMLVVLDNVPDSREVGPLVPGDDGSCVVVTSRSCLAGLVATHGAHLLVLGLPSHADARALFVNRVGAQRAGREPAAVDDIVAGCGRLPQAVAAVAAHASSRGTFPLAQIASELPTAPGGVSELGRRYDNALRDAFSWSFERISTPARRLLGLLARRGDAEFPGSAVPRLAGLPKQEARHLLDELVDAQLLTEYRPGGLRLHALVRVYAVERGVGRAAGSPPGAAPAAPASPTRAERLVEPSPGR